MTPTPNKPSPKSIDPTIEEILKLTPENTLFTSDQITNIYAQIQDLINKARIEELKKVGCCDYWVDGCSINVCYDEQLARIKELEEGEDTSSHISKEREEKV